MLAYGARFVDIDLLRRPLARLADFFLPISNTQCSIGLYSYFFLLWCARARAVLFVPHLFRAVGHTLLTVTATDIAVDDDKAAVVSRSTCRQQRPSVSVGEW